MPLLLAIVVVIAIVLAIAYIGKEARKENAPTGTSSKNNISDIDPEKSLLNMCKGDVKRFENLIAEELELRPKISRKQAIKNALYRLRNVH